jgi:hypothetical protein
MSQHLPRLPLTRPLRVLDRETTGTSPQYVRSIEAAVVKFKPGDTRRRFIRSC